MRHLALLYLLLLALVTYSCVPAPTESSSPISEAEKSPLDYAYVQRAYPYGQVKPAAYRTAMRQWQALRREVGARNLTLDWTSVGPTNVGGRISALAVHPNNRDELYVGAASGGIFKTLDGGTSWVPVFDDALSLSIGDVVLAPSDAQTVYVGTGEANAGGGSLAYDGMGIYRSDDGGASWTHLGLTDVGSIGKVAVHPTDASTVFVAAMGHLFANGDQRGLYRTTDAGTTWEKVLEVNDSTGFIDVLFDPYNPDRLFAASWERVRRPDRRDYNGFGSRIWRSEDGGDTWTQLGGTDGLPVGELGRIGLAAAASQEGRFYTIIEDDAGSIQGIYSTADYGTTWTLVPSIVPGSGFQWWFGKIYVDPTDAEISYVFTLHMWRVTPDNPGSFVSAGVHVDQHALYIDPADPDFMWLGNDGGLYRTQDGAVNWEHINNLPITQFYRCELNASQPDQRYGGTQDNGTQRTLTGAPDDWERIKGGDGFVCLVDPQDDNFVYAESQYGNLARSTDGGNNFTPALNGIDLVEPRNWNMPVVFDPTDPSILYCGTDRLYRSTDRAQNWSAVSPQLADDHVGNLVYGTLTSIAVSPVDPDYILAGTDDSKVWRTLDGGTQWELVSDNLPNRWVTSLSFDPENAAIAYVTFSGYRWDEYIPHVFRTEDAGTTWQSIGDGLPEVPVNDLLIRPAAPNELVLATDAGIFYSIDSGASWTLADAGLPKVPVNELDYDALNDQVLAATYGRSMYLATLPPISSTHDPTVARVDFTVAPNPVTDHTVLHFDLTVAETISIDVFDLKGALLTQVHPGRLAEGRHAIRLEKTWAASSALVVLRTENGGVRSRLVVSP